MRILLITDLYPLFDGEKGIPLTIKAFAEGFVERGHLVEVFRPNLIPNVLIRKRKLYKNGCKENNGIRVYNKNFLTPFRKHSVLRAYKKYFKGETFDVIIAHMPSGIMCADIISKEYNIPFLAAVHSSDITVLKSFKYALFKKRMVEAYKNASCILPRSFWLKEKIKKTIPDIKQPVEIIYSGVPLEITEENEKTERTFNSKKAKIICASSLIERKNIKNLILAYKKLKKKHPKVTLEIIGEGPLREKLEILNIKNKLDVKFLGQLSKEDVFKKMKEADIFILPSKNETFGMVYMEALSFGMAVCCTKNSGIDGIIEDTKNGYLLKPNKKGIYETLNKILSIKPKQFLEVSKNALTTAKMFSYENSIKNYLEKIELFRL
ncbi:MAG: glycosyltransferase family 4 protein [Candidatus Gastranaerophilales bacterium]|nr:glycosyltransferase family 4 protein [Candidatus Gastranaerophilales bacterium]